MARIAGVSIQTHQHTVIGLTAAICVLAVHAQRKSVQRHGVTQPPRKIKDLDDSELEKLRDEIGKFIVEGDLRRELSMNIKTLDGLGLLSAACVIVRACRVAVSVRVPMHVPARDRVKPRNR